VLMHEAAGRILRANRQDESYRLLEDAVLQIGERRKSEVKRFKKYYDANIDNLRNYDRVIDTTFAAPELVVERILTPDMLETRPGIWLSPRNLVPTQDAMHFNAEKTQELASSIAKNGFDENRPIGVLYVNHAFFIVEGHRRAGAAIRLGLQLVPLTLLACDDEPYVSEPSARSFVEKAVREGTIRAWEDAMDFRYLHPIWRLPHHA
jgi:ParB-like nuclease domain